MARTARADVSNAGAVFYLGSHLVYEAFDGVVGGLCATGHHAGTFQCTLGTSGNTHADVAKTFAFQLCYSPFCVGVKGVTTIDKQVALLEIG